MHNPRLPIALALLATLSVTACAGPPQAQSDSAAEGAAYPVVVESCEQKATFDAAPERAVTIFQGATEVMLALELQDRMAGTAYLDDEISPKWQAAYDQIPVISPETPDKETLLEAKPDFVYSSYSSSFSEQNVGSQSELDELGIPSYLSPFGCGKNAPDREVTWPNVWSEIDAIAEIFNVTERADAIIAAQEDQLAAIEQAQSGAGLTVFWFDSGDNAALAGTGEGGPQLILDAVGATNIFADLDGGWAEVAWEEVIAANPDVIVFADAGWSTAQEKIAQLQADPALAGLAAVSEARFVTLPFSESTTGVRLIDGAQTVSDQIAKLDLP